MNPEIKQLLLQLVNENNVRMVTNTIDPSIRHYVIDTENNTRVDTIFFQTTCMIYINGQILQTPNEIMTTTAFGRDAVEVFNAMDKKYKSQKNSPQNIENKIINILSRAIKTKEY